MSADILHKQINATVSDEGQVEAVFSVFDVTDRDGDVVTRSALAPHNGKSVPMVGSHDWGIEGWIGKGRIVVGEKDARFVGQFFMDTTDGEQAYRKVKNMGDLQQWSWGFQVTDSHYEKQAGETVRLIDGTEPFEVSPVLVGANQYTSTTSIKAVWDTAYVDALPDSAFAVIDDNGRHLPHHDKSGAVDEPHLRNALSREPQTNLSAANHAKAKAHLEHHAEVLGIGDEGGKGLARILVELDHLEEKGRMGQMQMDALHAAMQHMKAIHGAVCTGANCPMDDDGDEKAIDDMEMQAALVSVDAALAVARRGIA